MQKTPHGPSSIVHINNNNNNTATTMNVDAIHYLHGSIPLSERRDSSYSRGDRIETVIPIGASNDTALPVSLSNNRLLPSSSSLSTSNPSNALNKKKKKSSTTQQKQASTISSKLPIETKVIVDLSTSSSYESADDGLYENEKPRSPLHKHDLSVPIAVVEQPASGTNPDALKRPLRPTTGLETDFFLQPTILSRLILNQKYGRAIQRVFNHSEEASTWLCAKHTSSLDRKRASRFGESSLQQSEQALIHSLRQLPIHLACSNLGRTQDKTAMTLLNELLSVLVFAYPDGAHTPDHRNVYPVQEAIWYGAMPETVAIFFMAKPESLLILDHHGRSLSEINQYRKGTGKDAIQRMIDRDVKFWKVARDEAALRLQHNTNLYPSENKSIGSESVLASPNAEEETIFTVYEPIIENSYYAEHVTPLSWDQLEQRTRATEQILQSVNEENFLLKQQLESLTNKTSHTHVSLMKELKRLDDENAMLNEKLYQLEQLLKDRCDTDNEEKNEQFRLAMAEVSSLVGISEPSSIFSGFRASDSKLQLDAESTSQRLYEEAVMVQKQLSKKHLEQREKIRKLRHMVSYTIINDATINNESDIEKDSSSSFADVSTVSALSLETARSDVSQIIHKKRFHYNEGVVDRLPNETHVLDDLSRIIQFAASRQEAAAKKQGRPVRVQDDLSGILRWAAKKDRREIFYSSNNDIESVESTWSPIHPKEIWNSIPPKQYNISTQKSKNKVPAPTTTPMKLNRNINSVAKSSPADAVYTKATTTTTTTTTKPPATKKSPPATASPTYRVGRNQHHNNFDFKRTEV